ncbi:MAG: hypothetical protein F6K55_31260 [Moorea sp. SIO4A3]|nr:hypothetical protein [Moorena sp. SIO4A3]
MQRGLGEAARSWEFPPLALCIKTGVGKREQKFSQFLHGLVYIVFVSRLYTHLLQKKSKRQELKGKRGKRFGV